jgi:hypothetical protein
LFVIIVLKEMRILIKFELEGFRDFKVLGVYRGFSGFLAKIWTLMNSFLLGLHFEINYAEIHIQSKRTHYHDVQLKLLQLFIQLIERNPIRFNLSLM